MKSGAARAPRPIVLLIVFGLFLAVLGVTRTDQTILVSAHFSNAALNEILGSDAGTVRSFVNLNLLNEDLTVTTSAARRQALGTALRRSFATATLRTSTNSVA